jgi:hypothetical protein
VEGTLLLLQLQSELWADMAKWNRHRLRQAERRRRTGSCGRWGSQRTLQQPEQRLSAAAAATPLEFRLMAQ